MRRVGWRNAPTDSVLFSTRQEGLSRCLVDATQLSSKNKVLGARVLSLYRPTRCGLQSFYRKARAPLSPV